MQEVWKDVSEYEGIYQVSNHGRVMRNEKILKPYICKGYEVVSLCKQGKTTKKYVHRLVAEAFCERPIGCDVINHLDSNSTNNNAKNLEWTTQKENVRHAIRQERLCCTNHTKAVEARKKRCMCIETGEIFNSMTEAANEKHIHSSSISYVCSGKKETVKGYHWKCI